MLLRHDDVYNKINSTLEKAGTTLQELITVICPQYKEGVKNSIEAKENHIISYCYDIENNKMQKKGTRLNGNGWGSKSPLKNKDYVRVDLATHEMFVEIFKDQALYTIQSYNSAESRASSILVTKESQIDGARAMHRETFKANFNDSAFKISGYNTNREMCIKDFTTIQTDNQILPLNPAIHNTLDKIR